MASASGLSAVERNEILRKLKDEKIRIRTFRKWPLNINFMLIQDMAKYGFFYYNVQDCVQCAYCLGIIGNWMVGDDVAEEHARLMPNCPFVLGLPVGNIPKNPDDVVIFPKVKKDRIRDEESTIATNCGIYINKKEPKHLGYTNVVKRKQTFNQFPRGIGINIEYLANAGFIYRDYSDVVICFHCDGQLKGWKANHDPWIEHKRWFPECYFIHKIEMLSLVDVKQLDDESGFIQLKQIENVISDPVSIKDIENTEDNNYVKLPCKVCLINQCEVVILPCGHIAICRRCSEHTKDCPVCRGSYSMIIPIYIS